MPANALRMSGLSQLSGYLGLPGMGARQRPIFTIPFPRRNGLGGALGVLRPIRLGK